MDKKVLLFLNTLSNPITTVKSFLTIVWSIQWADLLKYFNDMCLFKDRHV